MDVQNMIDKMHENPKKLMETCIALSKMQIVKIDKSLSEKQRWYLLTADEVKTNPDKLSIEEKTEFLNIHLKLVELYNIKHGKASLN